MPFALQLLITFLVGSIPFGLFVAKLFGVPDVRKVGSGNIGATNVVRAAGWKAGAITYLLDFFKALVPMLLFTCTSAECTGPNIWIGLTAVLGHCYSPFMKFNGGKGVASAFGVLFALDWRIGLGCALAYGLTLKLTRISALGSLISMLGGLVAILLTRTSRQEHIAAVIMITVILYRHKSNWGELIKKYFVFLILFGFMDCAYATTDYKRVVAMMPAIAEMMIEMKVGSRLIGAPEYTRIPDEYKNKIKILGPYPRISAETIYALKADLVIASKDGNDIKTIQALEKLGIPVTLINTQSVSDIVESAKTINKILKAGQKKLITKLEKELTFTDERAPLKIFVQVGWNPLVTVSAKTYIGEIVSLTGSRNIFGNDLLNYPKPSIEAVLNQNPDIIIICPMTDDGSDAKPAFDHWMKFNELSAVKRRAVIIMPVDSLTKPGFGLIKGVERLRQIVRGQLSK